MIDWPPEYDASALGRPHWTVPQALDVGAALARLMLSKREFAMKYLSTVKKYYADFGEHSTEYFVWLDEAIQAAELPLNTQGCNAHDFANAHRAAWLFSLEAFACLVDTNPHGHDWGDPPIVGTPPHRGISRGDEHAEIFHNIPNATGSFAISTDDIPAPPLSR
jgi:hypothetical protein